MVSRKFVQTKKMLNLYRDRMAAILEKDKTENTWERRRNLQHWLECIADDLAAMDAA